MFKKSLFFVYSLSAIFVFAVLFACGDSGNSPDPGNSSNSNQPPSAAQNPANAEITITFPTFNPNDDSDYLDISIQVKVAGTLAGGVPATLDKVEIYQGSSIIKTESPGRNSYNWSDSRYDISKYCSGEQKICAFAYLPGDPTRYKGEGDNNCKAFTRDGSKGSCKSSSSLESLSSSSAAEVPSTLSFQAPNTVNIYYAGETRGIILSSGTAGNIEQSDIYLALEDGSEVMKTTKAGVTMIEEFVRADGYGDITRDAVPENSVTPQQFKFGRVKDPKNVDYGTSTYFMVLTDNVTEWNNCNNKCYLVLWPARILNDGKAEMKVWKVVQR
jgi:hypothetical protein